MQAITVVLQAKMNPDFLSLLAPSQQAFVPLQPAASLENKSIAPCRRAEMEAATIDLHLAVSALLQNRPQA